MKGTALTRTTGIILAAIGLFSIIGWYAHLPRLISIYPGQASIVFNSALAFLLLAMAFLATELKIQWQQKIYFTIGTFVALLGLITLAQNMLNHSFGIDQIFFEPWLIDKNPHPGRMADNSAYVFLFSGLSLILFANPMQKNTNIPIQICIFSTLILGFSALTGYLFEIKVLYSWNLYTQMSLPSAIGNSFLGLGLWSLWHQNRQDIDSDVSSGSEGKQLVSLSLTILFCTVLLSSFAVIRLLSEVTPINQHLVEMKSVILVAIVTAMGILLWQLVPLIRQMMIQLQNMRIVKKAEEQLRHLAYHDALTGLYNRNSLEEKMHEIINNADRNNHGFALIFLDLDRFKNVNDTIGHDAGDILLQVVGQRIENTVRATDVIARIGGDEFVLILSEINQVDKISNILRHVVNHLMQPISIKGHEIYVTTSMGISVYPYDGNDVETLMKNADLALYRAKELGRNNYQFCTLEMTTRAQQKMTLQNAVVQAMAKNEFALYFQPKLNLASQTVCGVEALLRWQNPEYANVNASEIIHHAEDTGLIIALNEWVFRTACLQVREWQQSGFFPLTLSVNISGKQFKQLNFVENLLKMLDETRFPSQYLELDMTEDLIMHDPSYIQSVLQSLKAKEISIAIDDFGTGYSSLDYLRRFSIDKIKIDKKFIQSLTIDVANTSIVSAIIAMSNKLGIKTVAEGVETQEQYEFLLQEKCTEIQGYYLSPPADVDTIFEFLKNRVLQT